MSVASDFECGDKVVMTEKGKARRLIGYAKSDRGVVIAIREPFSVKVRRDGLKSADWYHCSFWEKMEKINVR